MTGFLFGLLASVFGIAKANKVQEPIINTGIVFEQVLVDGYENWLTIVNPHYKLGGGRSTSISKYYDCSSLIGYYGYKLGILTTGELSGVSSSRLKSITETKSIKDVKRGDMIYMKSKNGGQNHIAMVSKVTHSGASTNIVILDNMKNHITYTTFNNIRKNWGDYTIYIIENPLIHLAMERNVSMPTTFHIQGVATWYDYSYKGIEVTKYKSTCALRITQRYAHYIVRNVDNGKVVVCKQTDYGPKEYTNKVIDLSSFAFSQINPLSRGVANVTVDKLYVEIQ